MIEEDIDHRTDFIVRSRDLSFTSVLSNNCIGIHNSSIYKWIGDLVHL